MIIDIFGFVLWIYNYLGNIMSFSISIGTKNKYEIICI